MQEMRRLVPDWSLRGQEELRYSSPRDEHCKGLPLLPDQQFQHDIAISLSGQLIDHDQAVQTGLRDLGQLFVKCAKCGALYSSGIVTDLETLQKKIESFRDVTTKCSFCRHENVCKIANMIYTVLT